MVSQWNSSSLRLPSAWLCWLVSGASMNRFAIAGPCVKESVSKAVTMASLSQNRSVSADPR